MNNWTGIGRLTADPETNFAPSGTQFTTFTIAIDRPRKDQQGNKVTDFVTIKTVAKLAEHCANYITKGRLVGVVGEWNSRTYENRESQKVKVWEVFANNVQFLDRGDNSGQSTSRNTTTSQPTQRYEDDPFAGDEPLDISDDDLPF